MKLHDVTQGALEVYEQTLLEKNEDNLSAAKFNRLALVAAKAAKIATDLPDDLMTLKPYEVAELSAEVAAHIRAAKAPPDPN